MEYQLRPLLGWSTVAKKKKTMLKITQTRSGIGRQDKHRRTLRALGIKRHQQSVVHEDSPAIRGMISQISFMVDVHEVED
mgnify:FL=1